MHLLYQRRCTCPHCAPSLLRDADHCITPGLFDYKGTPPFPSPSITSSSTQHNTNNTSWLVSELVLHPVSRSSFMYPQHVAPTYVFPLPRDSDHRHAGVGLHHSLKGPPSRGLQAIFSMVVLYHGGADQLQSFAVLSCILATD